jgi:HK97 family phage major capsid protein
VKLDKFNDSLNKKAEVESLEAKHKELVDMIAKLPGSEAVKKMQDQLDAMDVKMQSALMNTQQNQKTVKEQLKDFLTSDAYKAAAKNKGAQYEFDLKANELTTSNSFTETSGPVIQRLYEPGVISAPQRPTPIWDLLSKGTISSDFVVQTERSSQTIGASATHVSEAGVFGQSYAGWTTYVWGVNKIAEYIKVAREKLEDWEYVRGEVMDMLTTNIPHIRENKFLTGYNATQVWLGIINTTAQVAKDFAVPTGFNPVSNWNYFDVLRAAILQVELGNSANLANKQGYNANAILMNPADVANLELTKDVDGGYLRPMWASGYLNVGGVRIIPTIYMTASKFLVGDFSQAKAWVSRSLNVNMWDQNDTDPIYDLVTFTASHRLAFGIGAVRAYAFVYGDFDTAGPLIAA